MWVVVVYDVVADRRRRRFHDGMKAYLEPVQKSVFEGRLAPTRLRELEALIPRELDLGEDAVRVYLLCRGCAPLARSFGVQVDPSDPDAPVVI